MNNIYFINKIEKRLIGKCFSYKEGSDIIEKFLKERKYKSYYTRNWETKEGLMFDVGSYSEFFLIENMKLEEIINVD